MGMPQQPGGQFVVSPGSVNSKKKPAGIPDPGTLNPGGSPWPPEHGVINGPSPASF